MRFENVLAVILAGGLARRMEGADKSTLEVAGKPTIEHVIERVRPSVGHLIINANRHHERLGAYGVGVDALSHRASSKGAPGYKAIGDTFGKWILASDGQIDRGKLGNMVFSHPEALKTLESIVHPLVRDAIDVLIRRS